MRYFAKNSLGQQESGPPDNPNLSRCLANAPYGCAYLWGDLQNPAEKQRCEEDAKAQCNRDFAIRLPPGGMSRVRRRRGIFGYGGAAFVPRVAPASTSVSVAAMMGGALGLVVRPSWGGSYAFRPWGWQAPYQYYQPAYAYSDAACPVAIAITAEQMSALHAGQVVVASAPNNCGQIVQVTVRNAPAAPVSGVLGACR
jgi:hypothetical protein